MSSPARFAGGCHCGQVRFEAAGPAVNLCYCHCETCRRATGAPMVPWAGFARAQFVVLRGELTEYQSSAKVHRGFCAQCGASLTYRNDDYPSELDVTLSTLEDAALLVPEVHIWVQDKLPWVVIADGKPQFPRSRPDGPQAG